MSMPLFNLSKSIKSASLFNLSNQLECKIGCEATIIGIENNTHTILINGQMTSILISEDEIN